MKFEISETTKYTLPIYAGFAILVSGLLYKINADPLCYLPAFAPVVGVVGCEMLLTDEQKRNRERVRESIENFHWSHMGGCEKHHKKVLTPEQFQDWKIRQDLISKGFSLTEAMEAIEESKKYG